MTQRIFDIENEKDMSDLWDILQDHIIKIEKPYMKGYLYPKYVLARSEGGEYELPININWHDRTEITRPIQEATEQDIGKICMFFNSLSNSKYYGVLIELRETVAGTRYVAQSCNGTHPFVHAYRLTKQEIEELC